MSQVIIPPLALEAAEKENLDSPTHVSKMLFNTIYLRDVMLINLNIRKKLTRESVHCKSLIKIPLLSSHLLNQ